MADIRKFFQKSKKPVSCPEEQSSKKRCLNSESVPVSPEPQMPEPQPELQSTLQSTPQPEPQTAPQTAPQPAPQPEPQPEPQTAPQTAPQPNPQPQPRPEHHPANAPGLCQPRNYAFPQTNGRRCNAEWFQSHPFLSYDKKEDCLRCHWCCQAVNRKLKKQTDYQELLFLTGFRNWAHGREKFVTHQNSAAHKDAMIVNMAAATTPVSQLISGATAKEQAQNCEVFLEIICTLRGLARSGSAIRGHADSDYDGKLMTMLDERAETSKVMKQWLKKRNNFLSHDCINELITLMGTMVQREIAHEARESLFFGVIADGTTDLSTKEQFSICVRYLTPKMEVKEACLGLYEAPGSTAAELYAALKDALLRTMHGLEKLRGCCFDGAANMSGRHTGVRTRLTEEQPLALYVHCVNHSLDLALQEEAKNVGSVASALNTVRDVASYIKTTKRLKIFEEIAITDEADLTRGSRRLRTLCPTRWSVRTSALQRFITHYGTVIKTLREVGNDTSVLQDTRHTIRGYLYHLERFETLYGMVMCEALFSPCELLAKALQKPDITCGDVIHGSSLLLSKLDELRESGFDTVWQHCEDRVRAMRLEQGLEIHPPREPRATRPPKRLEHSLSAAAPASLTAKDELRRDFLEAVDRLRNEVNNRFQQESLKRLQCMENLLLNAEPASPEQLREQLTPLDQDLDLASLSAQLSCLRSFRSTVTSPSPSTVSGLAAQIVQQGVVCQAMLSEVLRLASLVMAVPMSGATAERSFSVLKRVKDSGRTTMTQQRLSNLVLLAIHKDRAKSLRPRDILSAFIENHPKNRMPVFGRITV